MQPGEPLRRRLEREFANARQTHQAQPTGRWSEMGQRPISFLAGKRGRAAPECDGAECDAGVAPVFFARSL